MLWLSGPLLLGADPGAPAVEPALAPDLSASVTALATLGSGTEATGQAAP
jgi:hypothetical protein